MATATWSRRYKLNPNLELILIIYKLTPSLEQAIVYGSKALQRATLQGNKEKEGSACGCLGIAYSCKGEHAKAIKWHEKYLQAAKKINNVTLEAQVIFFIFFRRPGKSITSPWKHRYCFYFVCRRPKESGTPPWKHRRVGTSGARTCLATI